MTSLPQPGAATDPRVEVASCRGSTLTFGMLAGKTLNQALTGPLVAAGARGAALEVAGVVLDPLVYVVPAPSPDGAHAAWFSAPRRAGPVVIEHARATFGLRDGAPFVHCHAVWTAADGTRGAGHILPHEAIVAQSAAVRAWALADGAITVEHDPETNFPLFRPLAPPPADDGLRLITRGVRPELPRFAWPAALGPRRPAATSPLYAIRVRPNQDLHAALEQACRRQRVRYARVRGGLGSLVRPVFADGRVVDSIATEFLVLDGLVTREASLTVALAGMDGAVHDGLLARGGNHVCITVEAILQPVG